MDLTNSDKGGQLTSLLETTRSAGKRTVFTGFYCLLHPRWHISWRSENLSQNPSVTPISGPDPYGTARNTVRNFDFPGPLYIWQFRPDWKPDQKSCTWVGPEGGLKHAILTRSEKRWLAAFQPKWVKNPVNHLYSDRAVKNGSKTVKNVINPVHLGEYLAQRGGWF